MTGIWSLPVHLIGDSFKGSALLARVVINIICLAGIIWAIYQQPPRSKTAFDGIRYGTFALLAWYIITILDLFLHETQIKAAYGYILLGFFLEALKIGSNILIIAAAHRVITAQIYECDQLRRWKAKAWLLTGEFLILVLAVMALYYLGSLLSNEVLWLGIANKNTLDGVVSRKEGLQAAFFAMQFLLASMVLGGPIMIAVVCRNDPSDGDEYIAIVATLLLWIRALTELIVSTHYHPVPDGNAAARDCIYGLCTILFLYLMNHVASDMVTSGLGGDPLQSQMEEDTRRHILQSVDSVVSNGNRPPALRNVLDGIKQNPTAALSTVTVQELSAKGRPEATRLITRHRSYVDWLLTTYGNLGQAQPHEEQAE